MFELKHAQNLSRLFGTKVFYIKLGNINDIKLKPEIKEVLSRQIYLKWPEGVRDATKIDRFYERLVSGIRGHELCASCSCCRPRLSNNRFLFDNLNVEADIDEQLDACENDIVTARNDVVPFDDLIMSNP